MTGQQAMLRPMRLAIPRLGLLTTVLTGLLVGHLLSAAVANEIPSDLAAAADAAVEDWLNRPAVDIEALASQTPEEICKQLPGLVASPPAPNGTTVVLEDRALRSEPGIETETVTYPAKVEPERLAVVEVTLERVNGEWSATRVGFASDGGDPRAWTANRSLQTTFLVLSVLLVGLLARPGPIRRVYAMGWNEFKHHRRLIIGTMLGGWALVAFGLSVGRDLPDACDDAILSVLEQTLTGIGAVAALESGNTARAALLIFYQNYVVVTVTLLFGSSLLLGIPAYLIAGTSFFVQTVAFGALGVGGGPLALAAVAVLFVLEFTAYFLVVSGGGMLLSTLVRRGFGGLPLAYRRAVLTLPWAGLLLLTGAWYEALILAI